MLSSFLPKPGHDFAYGYGRMGVLQQQLLDQSDVDRLLGATDIRDAEKMLTELSFTRHIDQGEQHAEDILLQIGEWIRREVETLSPAASNPIFHILWLEGDAALISYLIKEKKGLTSSISSEPLPPLTAYKPTALRKYIDAEAEGILPSHTASLISALLKKNNVSPQEIDTSVAAGIARIQLRLARQSGSNLIVQFVRHIIDLKNIRTTLRNSSDEMKKDSLLKGGTIALDDLLRKQGDVASVLATSSLYALTDVDQQDPVDLEHNMASILAKDIAHMWNRPLSIDPLFAFAAIGHNHLTVVRTILIGKRNELSPQEIKKIMPPFIPALHYLS